MKIGILKQFSTDLLRDRLEPLGFQRRGNAWYKTVPDIILCAEVRSLRGKAFDLCFGIVPFVCYSKFKLNLSCFQPDGAYRRMYPDKEKQFYSELYEMTINPSPRFSFSIDSTERELKDERKYHVLLKYWGEVFDKMIAPFLLNVNDLIGAVAAIGEYNKFNGHWSSDEGRLIHDVHYWPDHTPVFVKLGQIDEAEKCLESFVKDRIKDHGADRVEKLADDARDSNNLSSLFLWYKMLRDNDVDGMNKAIQTLESEARAWIKKEKLNIVTE